MLNRVFSVNISKNIARTSTTTFANIKEGEIVVCDKNKQIINTTGNAVVSTTNSIYIGVGTADTYTVTNSAGTTTTYRKVKFSAPIYGAHIKSVTSGAYAAAAEKVAKITATFTPVSGSEYVLRVIYRDIFEHPGQFTHTYRVIAKSTDTSTTIMAALATKINSEKKSRISAVASSNTITLTGSVIVNPMPLDPIDDYRQVDFVVTPFSNNFGTVTTLYNTNSTDASTLGVSVFTRGTGTYALVRDREKYSMPYRGITNQREWPIIKPTYTADSAATYNKICIESNVPYTSPDMGYDKVTGVTTEIYLANGLTSGTNANQITDFMAKLNSYIVSAGFATISTSGWGTYLS